MANIKGSKGLRGPNSEQDALRDIRSGAYDHGGKSDAPPRARRNGQNASARRPGQTCDKASPMPSSNTVRNRIFRMA